MPHADMETHFLNEYLRTTLLTPEMRERAHGVFEAAVAKLPELAKYRMVPQSPPYHAEGPHLRAHVERILACVLAVEAGASLTSIEEFARDPDILLAVADCEKAIREHASFFKVFALVHDAAKGEMVNFTADREGKGAAEGFATEKGDSPATSAELTRYDKLARAFAAEHPQLTPEQLGAKFFDEYGLSVHFYGHDRKGASIAYEPVRAALLHHFNVPVSYAKLMSEVIWNHIDALDFFARTVDGTKYGVLAARAGKAGLNVDTFLTFLACAVLLDGVLGSLQYHNGKFSTDPAPFLNMLASEAETVPARREARRAVVERGRKQALKDALAEAKLSPDEVFALIKTPHGPERGTVMNAVYDAIRGFQNNFVFGPAAVEIAERAALARKLLADRGLSL